MKRSLNPFIVFVAIAALPILFGHAQRQDEAPSPKLGRQVYIAEGCIHCHSQYIRPETIDESLWGDPHEPDFSRNQNPALIGNRRQGPDLMNVGLRRTREWQRTHLRDPRELVPTSRMPSYDHLFSPGDSRGEALLDYLNSLGQESDIAALKDPEQNSGIHSP